MSRPKKKSSDPEGSMALLMNRAVSLFEEPYDDRDGREADLPSLRAYNEKANNNNGWRDDRQKLIDEKEAI